MNANPIALLRTRFAEALGGMTDDPDAMASLVRPAQDARFGDYQANCAMPLAKRLGKKPRDVAAELIERVVLSDLVEPPEVAGPGFINLRLRRPWLEHTLAAVHHDPRLGVAPADPPETMVVDFSSPNVAKPMHVGHIRSTILGDALNRLLRFVGHRVISDNHLGDWGTQFGMTLVGYRRWGDEQALRDHPMDELVRLYTKTVAAAESDPAVADAARAELVKLHSGDADNLALWRRFMEHSVADMNRIYARLDVRFDHMYGESFYHELCPEVVDDLCRLGIARESEGAICIFYPNDELPPFLIRKRDGAFMYQTTDLAAIRYRCSQWQPDRILYVTDDRQKLHFQQLFAAARRWGYTPVLEHVWFGKILGEDGRPFRTRSGDTIRLEDLLDEAVGRALEVVRENSTHLPEPEQADIATAVGTGAIKYADLSQNRTSDYVFSWDRMLAMSGNTAPYMQYAYARVRSIFRQGDLDPEAFRRQDVALCLEHPTELALAVQLVRLSESLDIAAAEYKPNRITTYVYDLAQAYSRFYESCPVLKADAPTRQSRLALCDLCARTIRHALDLLGITTIERM